MHQITVELGPRSYPVIIASGMLSALGDTLRNEGLKQKNAFVITNPQVGGHYFQQLSDALTQSGFERVVRHDIPASEEGKNWGEFSQTCETLLKAFPDTGSIPLVFLMGGGVVGDLGGFAAAVFRRGVPFVQIPTSLLAAVDSSVGGKVAVNFGGVKNIMGVLNQPRLVFCDLAMLTTLSDRELRSGMAEVIKYGVVCSRSLFEQLEAGDLEKMLQRDTDVLADVVAQCVQLKADVVQQDEFDKLGIRNVLNFGHTIGHAIELSADYSLTHGEAISIGMIAAMQIAVELKTCDENFQQRLEKLFVRAQLPRNFSGNKNLFEKILAAMQMDKKFRDGKNLFVLPTEIGSWSPREDVPWPLIHQALRAVLA